MTALDFLRCHIGVNKLLDHAAEMGLLRSVDDEGKYFEHRDWMELLQNNGRWDELPSPRETVARQLRAWLGRPAGRSTGSNTLPRRNRVSRITGDFDRKLAGLHYSVTTASKTGGNRFGHVRYGPLPGFIITGMLPVRPVFMPV